MSVLRKIVCLIRRKKRDYIARGHLRKVGNKKNNADKKIKVAFFVQLVEIWDKLSCVYDVMKTSNDIEPYIVVVPSFDFANDTLCEYGAEREYFIEHYGEVIDAITPSGDVIDIDEYKFDYVFYQRPYDRYLPSELRSKELVKKTKICYIPYGFIGAKVFENNTHKEFFRNVYIGFMDSYEECKSIKDVYNYSVKKGYLNFVSLGYPVLEKFIKMDSDEKYNNILWTPRWTYDSKLGGSHFVEYKDHLLELKEKYNDDRVVVRPHPLTFPNMLKEGKMTEKEIEEYKFNIIKYGVELDANELIEDSIRDTDILITDFSSIMVMYFLTGKPMIYCKSDLELNEIYNKMLKGVYVANSWDEVEYFVDCIKSGNDYLKEIRQEIIEKEFHNEKNSAENIVKYIIEDYKNGGKR